VVQRDKFGKPLRDEQGKLLPMTVDETLRRLWLDAATLFLEGVSYKTMERELYQRYGHVDRNGKPYATNFVRTVYLTPVFWGHSARFFKDGRKHGWKVGAWIYDETLPPPEGVLLYRNTHEPVYTGELAERVKAELRRRETVSRGRSTSQRTGRFTGLFICAECTYYYGYDRRGKYVYLYCGARNVGTYRSRPCSQTTGLTEQEAQDFFDDLLRRVLDANSLAAAFAEAGSENDSDALRAEQVELEVADLEAQAQRLIVKQASSPDALSHMYDAEIKRIGERYKILKDDLERMRYAEERRRAESQEEGVVIGELNDLGLPAFWQLSDKTVNQMLHRLFGKKRFAVLDGEVLPRFVPPPPLKRR
jgi:hypothetical protein